MAYCPSPAQLLLILGSRVIDFMDEAGGYRVSSFELALPEVREILSAQPAKDGSYDSTRFFGPRAVTIAGSIVPSPNHSRGFALDQLMPFVDPSARPVLYYQVDGDQPQRTIGLRAAALSAPYTNATVSAFTVSWKAPDPLSYATSQTRATIPAGGQLTVTPGGNFRAWPTFHIRGPCTNPVVSVTSAPTGKFAMVYTTLAAGEYVDAAMDTHTVIKNDGSNQYNLVDQTQTTWPALAAAANTVTFTPATSGSGSGVDLIWRDSWL